MGAEGLDVLDKAIAAVGVRIVRTGGRTGAAEIEPDQGPGQAAQVAEVAGRPARPARKADEGLARALDMVGETRPIIGLECRHAPR